MGAALSFYTVLSLPALLVITIGIAGSIFGEGPAREEVLSQVTQWVGSSSADTVGTVIDATQASGRGSGTTFFGIGLLIFAAATVFSQMQSSLNTIWEASPPPSIKRGLLQSLKSQALSLAMVVIIGLVLLSLLLISTLLPLLGSALSDYAGGLNYIFHLVNIAVSVIIIALLFAFAYRYLPNTPVSWREAWPGALLAAALFTAGKFAIGLYLGHSNIVTAYGASSSLVFLLLWIYYSSQSFFIGAEFAVVLAGRHAYTGSPGA